MPTRALAALLLFALFAYGGVAAWPIIRGPVIAIDTPGSHMLLPGGHTLIEGTASNTETLWLNGAPLLMDEDGRFQAALTLPSGGAILSLTATDRFGREITERRSVYVQ